MDKKILIIEDEKKIAQLLKINFEGEGYYVDTASSGEEGLEKVAASKPDLVILDLKLLQMNGLDVCGKIKSDPEYKNIPVIVLTASSQKTDEKKSLEAGASGFFKKPFEINTVTKKINEMLGKQNKK